MSHARSSGAGDPPALVPRGGVPELPSPSCFLEFVARSRHLHLGYFESPLDPLARAQDRLIQRCLRILPRAARVADVGCGLGGTVQLLIAQGHTVMGVDPCARSIDYATKHTHSLRARFMNCDLAHFATLARGARFDAVFLTEVLTEISDLGAVFAQLRALVRPGGLVIVHDIVRARAAERLPFHPRGALRQSALAAGFDLMEARDLSHRTTPTLARLARALSEQEPEIRRVLGPTRPALTEELEACRAELREREAAFARQELFLESSFLRCSARFGEDSVVVRRNTGALRAREGE